VTTRTCAPAARNELSISFCGRTCSKVISGRFENVVSRYGALLPDERMVGAHDETPRIAEELDRLDALVVDGQKDEGGIELAAAKHLDVMLDVEILSQRDRCASGPEDAHDVGQERLRDALERADPGPFGARLLELLEVGAGRAQPRVDRAGVLDEPLSFLGERHLARASDPPDEAHADDPLERRDLPAHRGLAVAGLRGGGAERTFRCNRLESGEVPELDPLPTTRIGSHTR
jgi:hypothetical protein